MAISLPVPQNLEYGLYQLLTGILRRCVDFSVNPAQVNVGIRVTGNDITIASAGQGLVLTTRDGTKTYRLLVDNDGALALDRLT